MENNLSTAVIIDKQYLTDKIIYLKLQAKTPPKFIFNAGQFISILVTSGVFRSYSIASSSRITSNIELIISAGHEGVGASYIRNLNVGDTISYIGPAGRFKLHSPLKDRIYFFATGTGIAPFISMFYELMHNSYEGDILLYWGLRYSKNIFYTEVLNKFKKALNFTYTIALSREKDSPKLLKLNKDINIVCGQRITPFVSDIESPADIYICGNPNMVKDIKERLSIKENLDIFTEPF